MFLKVYIIILNWNNWKDTIECLESVFQMNYYNYQVIVCDNSSSDNSLEKIKNWIKNQNGDYIEIDEKLTCLSACKIKDSSQTILIQTGANLGYAGGNNIGIKFAMKQNDIDYIWILNNDTVVEKNSLNNLIKKCESDKKIGICGSKLMYYDYPEKIQGYGGKFNKFFATSNHILSEKDINKMDYVIGASMLVSKNFIESIGLMEEKYFLYYEELDWAIRGQDSFKISCACDSIVYHKEGASIGSSSNPIKRSALSDYYGIRNRIIFTKTFYKYYLPTVYIGLTLAIFNRIKRRQLDRVWMILKLMISCGEIKESGQ